MRWRAPSTPRPQWRCAPPHPPPPTPSGPSAPTSPHRTRARLGRPPNPHPNLDVRQAEVERAAKGADGHQASEVQSLREELAAQRQRAAAGSAMGLLAAAAREHEQVEA